MNKMRTVNSGINPLFMDELKSAIKKTGRNPEPVGSGFLVCKIKIHFDYYVCRIRF